MRIKHTNPSVTTKSWYLALLDAPEIEFRDGSMHSPSAVTVSEITNDGFPSRFYMEFSAPEVKPMGVYSSDESAVFPFSTLPAEFLAAIFKECK